MNNPNKNNNPDFPNVLARFEAMIDNQVASFFDEEELEELFNHYFSELELDRAGDVVAYGMETYPYSAYFHIKDAQLSLSEGDMEAAAIALQQAQVFEPANFEIYLLEGSMYDIQDNPRKALQCLKKAEFYAGDDKEPVFHALGHFYINREKFGTALHYYTQCVGLAAENPDILFELGYCYFQLEQIQEGIIFFSEYVEKDPFSDAAWFNLGTLYNRNQEFERAKEAFEFAAAIDDKNPNYHYSLGNVALNQSEVEEAQVSFEHALELEPQNQVILCALGVCLEKQSQYDEAIIKYVQAIRLDPEFPDPRLGAGYCFMMKEQYDKAEEYISTAVKLEPDNADIRFHMADVFSRQDLPARAEEEYRLALELDPDFSEATIELGVLLADEGKESEALALFENGLKKHGGDAYFLYRYAGFMISFGYEQEGLIVLQKALHLFPEEINILEEYQPEVLENPQVQLLLDQSK